MDQYLLALLGGMLIGAAGLFLFLFNGRVLGVSGIVGGLFQRHPELWRFCFLIGVFCGGILLAWKSPERLEMTLSRSTPALVLAGLLVGYGTRLGGGCTSGHGICGISRLSKRSIVATILFMATGALTVFLIQNFGGGRI